MKYLPLLFLAAAAMTSIDGSALAAPTVIVRDGWSFDQSKFNENAAKVAEAKAADKGLRLTGWAEYQIEIPRTGWYELWLGGCPPEWSRDVFVDGKTITRLQISTAADKLEKPAAGGVQFKEVNLYLEAGKHVLRMQRLSPPGILPDVWELRASDGEPECSIRISTTGSRIGVPGGAVSLVALGGGTGAASAYDLFWKNEATGEESTAGRVEFASTREPREKPFTVALPSVGLYTLQAKVAGRVLRPSDIKAGYFLSAKASGRPAPIFGGDAFQLAAPFHDGVVLQREKPLPVWGWAKAGETVTVTLGDQKEKTVAGKDGAWKVTFKPLSSGGGPLELAARTAGGKTLVCKDVLIGEVWLLSGQSNMGGPLLSSTGGNERAEKANFPDVRLTVAREGQQLIGGRYRLSPMGWGRAVAGDDARKAFAVWNAIPFAFGTEVSEALHVPVGLISDNRGGTFISTWISRELHETNASLRPIVESFEADERERVPELLHLIKLSGQLQKWRAETKKAEAEGRSPAAPPALAADITISNGPGFNYAKLIEPLGDFAIRGILWYQGESDSSMAAAHAERFPLLIESWRERWGDPAMPFLYAQIAYGSGNLYTGDPVESRGAELKQTQFTALSVPHTAMVVTDDLMKPGDDVHYPDKLSVGHRFALAALATVYGRDLVYSGPLYKAQQVDAGRIRLSFEQLDGGLAVRGGGVLGGFTIAGEDKRWFKADAVIDGDTVLVSSPRVTKPVAVRYSWADQPSGANLMNKAGLPSPVFRTDDWPMSTEGVLWEKKN